MSYEHVETQFLSALEYVGWFITEGCFEDDMDFCHVTNRLLEPEVKTIHNADRLFCVNMRNNIHNMFRATGAI